MADAKVEKKIGQEFGNVRQQIDVDKLNAYLKGASDHPAHCPHPFSYSRSASNSASLVFRLLLLPSQVTCPRL